MTFLTSPLPAADVFEKTIARVTERIGKQYSCASVAVVNGDRVLLRFCAGNRQDYSGTEFEHYDPKPVSFSTLYDLASVSKLVSTTMVALRMMEDGAFSPYDSLWRFLDDIGNYPNVEMRHLMTHTSGLSPHIPLYNVCESPDDALFTILHSDPLGKPGEQVRYSCMGYILLQKILERIAGTTLDRLADELVFTPLGMTTACYNPLEVPGCTGDIAATELSSHTGYYICGHVHDENAHFLGGVSGNAGVFATLDDMIRFAMMLSGRGTIGGKHFLNRRTFEMAVHNWTPGLDEDRGLGFSLHCYDLSASGEFTSPGSYGHNGYTGTSIYCDAETGTTMILLTNSVHYGRDNRGPFFRDRRIFHNVCLTEADRALGFDTNWKEKTW